MKNGTIGAVLLMLCAGCASTDRDQSNLPTFTGQVVSTPEGARFDNDNGHGKQRLTRNCIGGQHGDAGYPSKNEIVLTDDQVGKTLTVTGDERPEWIFCAKIVNVSSIR